MSVFCLPKNISPVPSDKKKLTPNWRASRESPWGESNMNSAVEHPTTDELKAFALGTLCGPASTEIETHLADCMGCQKRVAATEDDSIVDLLRTAFARVNQTTESQAESLSMPMRNSDPFPTHDGSYHETPLDATEKFLLASPPPPPPDLVNHGRYTVLRFLGRGGMGAVFEAEHRLMRRRVALKVIHRELTANPTVLGRFRREVQTAAQLSHPNVVATYDAEDAGNAQFLVMELVHGVTLATLVRNQGPLPVAQACDYIRQAALGLQHAHERGLVHRDVKSSNLIRCDDGTVKVLDFGLATLTSEPGNGLTEEDMVMGTPDFMAPELATDPHGADTRADIYGLGCTLYELLAGHPPYSGKTSLQKVVAHREQPIPSIASERADVPSELERVMRRMLAKHPRDRFQSPGEVAKALQPFIQSDPPKKRRSLFVAVSLALFAMVLFSGFVYRIATDNGELMISTKDSNVEVLVKQGGKIVQIVDTKTRQQVTLRSGEYDLELKDGAEGLKLQIEKATILRGKTALATVERFSKDGRSSREIAVASVHEPIRYLTHRAQGGLNSVAFSPDSRLLAAVDSGVANHGTISIWDTATGKKLQDFPSYGWGKLQFLPDGKRIIVLLPQGVRVFNIETKKVVRDLANSGSQTWGAMVSNDGRYIRVWFADLTQRLYDLSSGEELYFWPANSKFAPYCFNHDGSRIALGNRKDPNQAIQYWDITAKKEIPGNGVPFRGLFIDSFLISKFVVACRDGALHFHDVDTGKHLRQINLGSKMEGDRGREGALSPRGDRFFCPDLDGTYRLWDLATGKQLPVPQSDPPRMRVSDVAISPDGRWAAVPTMLEVVLVRLPEPSIPAKP